MSIISTTILHSMSLGASGAYASPLTIAATGAVEPTGAGAAAIYDFDYSGIVAQFPGRRLCAPSR